jgi:hypothetical protein
MEVRRSDSGGSETKKMEWLRNQQKNGRTIPRELRKTGLYPTVKRVKNPAP